MAGARVLARALAALARQHAPGKQPGLAARSGEFADAFGGFAGRAGPRWRAPSVRDRAGAGTFASSALFSKVSFQSDSVI
jgi:hypothetical protein